MFLPTTKNEMDRLGWDKPDIILVTGDTYIDSSFMGVSVIGRVLADRGYKVGIIAQPDISNGNDIQRLGEPALFWGVTSGSVDSMVSNYTAAKKRRKRDDLTPGGINNRRPDRAVIVYTNLIKRYCSKSTPIVLGGIEASLRRIAHYDYWDNKIRRSILFDSKADFLVYGMGEKAILELADSLRNNKNPKTVSGICYIAGNKVDSFVTLPSFEEVQDKNAFSEMFKLFSMYCYNDKKKGLQQLHRDRYLVHNPPALALTTRELDHIYNLPYERKVHPYYGKLGTVKALDTIRFSVTTHRGCFGGCNFCAIGVHQGKRITSRSRQSIIDEIKIMTASPGFKGIISDIGGPTANMYEMDCKQNNSIVNCKKRSCLQDITCNNLDINHSGSINLLKAVRKIPNIKKIFIQSGIRYDLILSDKKYGEKYMQEIITHHISGQLKVAPEHSEQIVLSLMNKPSIDKLITFKKKFDAYNQVLDKKQYLTYYFIAAHPGTTIEDMIKLKHYIKKYLKLTPQQVQIFTPTPSTCSTTMYLTEKDPYSNKKIFVEKDINRKEKQKKIII